MTGKDRGGLAAMAADLASRPTKPRRGRPRGTTKSAQPITFLIRRLELVGLYEAARQRGLKHTDALVAVVTEMKSRRPGMKGVNRAEVERARRELQPERAADGTRCASAWTVTLTETGGELRVGPRPRRR